MPIEVESRLLHHSKSWRLITHLTSHTIPNLG